MKLYIPERYLVIFGLEKESLKQNKMEGIKRGL